ncbi:hypothetical protein LIER_41158 [Lithospermum erythrorhizon]|uniref:Uncharacterized protein n=1 Tax=Lithospermum erythrorhizon TaxID=34254 RepID=A0AAV3R6Z4_LITER
MLTEATKKNPNIMSILKGVGVMSTVEIVGPYYPKLVMEFICNMTEDIDDSSNPNFYKGDIFTTEDVEGPAPGFITLCPKLIQGRHVADITLQEDVAGGASRSGINETVRILRDEIHQLDGVIQTSLAWKSVLEARLRSLTRDVDPAVDPSVVGSGVEAAHTDLIYGLEPITVVLHALVIWDK